MSIMETPEKVSACAKTAEYVGAMGLLIGCPTMTLLVALTPEHPKLDGYLDALLSRSIPDGAAIAIFGAWLVVAYILYHLPPRHIYQGPPTPSGARPTCKRCRSS
jgi:hypothetical protein